MCSLSIRQNYLNCNDYETTKTTWKEIIEYIPSDKLIYEPFYLNGKSKEYLIELGLKQENIIHVDKDFFDYHKQIKFDIIISNPPFDKKKIILQELKKIDKPFILLLPIAVITKSYFKKLYKNNIQILIPKHRTQFNQFDNDKKNNIKSNVYFDCIFVCYKCNFTKDIIYL
jgi:hypothetical protein